MSAVKFSRHWIFMKMMDIMMMWQVTLCFLQVQYQHIVFKWLLPFIQFITCTVLARFSLGMEMNLFCFSHGSRTLVVYESGPVGR
jgi:hypothetical protein